MKYEILGTSRRVLRLGSSVAAIAASLAICVGGANAQMNRSHPPSSSRSSGGYSGRRASSPAPRSSGSTPSYRSDRGQTPTFSPGIGSTIENPRGGEKPVDRYNKSNEAAAARDLTARPHVFYGPIYPFGYFPGGYYPGGYIPGGYPPYPYPIPDPTYPYPIPRGGAPLAARYDSPYFFCDDLSGARYVSGGTVIISKPKHLYTPTPVYKDGELESWRNLGADNYLADRNVEGKEYIGTEIPADDAALEKAIADIRQSWIDGDVGALADHVSKDEKVAIVLDGKYLYSLQSGDFLGVTQAAYASTTHLRFIWDHLHRRNDGVFALTGRHLFADINGKERTAYFTYILTKGRTDYTITQVGAASDRE